MAALGVDQNRQHGGLKEGFAKDTAAKSGKPLRSIERDITRSRKLGPDLDRVAGTSLDKGAELDALAGMPADRRAPIIARAAAFRAQADALEIEALAKRRLADEYDAAQERGEVAKAGDPRPSKAEGLATVAQIGLTHKEIHEARIIRDAEKADPGIVRRTLDDALASGKEPTKAQLRKAVSRRCSPTTISTKTRTSPPR